MREADRSLTNSIPFPDRLVLLVDNSRAQRRMLAIQLTRAGYRVAEAGSAAEAMGICAHERPQIVISDWTLGESSGLDLCREYRSACGEEYGYFILLTTKSGKTDFSQGFAAGADEFLIKPISGPELLARIGVAERILTMQAKLQTANARLTVANAQLRAAQSAIERDLQDARILQQSLIRERSRQIGAFRVTLLLRPAGHIGGDMVGVLPINGSRIGLYALDVSGHGVTSALLAARLAAQLSDTSGHSLALRINDLGLFDALSPREVLQTLNRQLLEELRLDTYYTMLYADLDIRSGDLRFVQAGHPHPVLQHPDGRIERVGDGGLPVGVLSDARFDELRLTLPAGGRLLIASDGITDCESPSGSLLGDEGLAAIMQTNATLHGRAFLESLSWSVGRFSGGQRKDDVSAVLIERLP